MRDPANRVIYRKDFATRSARNLLRRVLAIGPNSSREPALPSGITRIRLIRRELFLPSDQPQIVCNGRVGINHRVHRIGESQAAHRPAIDTTLSPAGAGSDSSPVRVMSSMECSVMYLE